MRNKELLQYGVSTLLVLGLLGLIAQNIKAEDRRLDAMCGDDRSSCMTQVVEELCVTGPNWPGVIYECDGVEYVPLTSQPLPTP